jgi:hypothetical protein
VFLQRGVEGVGRPIGRDEGLADALQQDEAHAADFLDRLAPIRARDTTAATLPGESPHALLAETARHLALWMSYEDTVRVADLKTRRSRFERVAAELRLADGQVLGRPVDVLTMPDGALLVSDGDQVAAVGWYARGYYYEAKRKGLLEETGLRS